MAFLWVAVETLRHCFRWRPLDWWSFHAHSCSLGLSTQQGATGTALLRSKKGLQHTKIQRRNRRRSRKDVTLGIRRRSQVENTNRNTLSHITITHTIPRLPNGNQLNTFCTRIPRETGKETENTPVYCLSRPLSPFPQLLFSHSLVLFLISSISSHRHKHF